jgi:hypothetical protein
MNIFQLLILTLLYLIPNVHSNCIWYEGIRDSYNALYLNGPPKSLPLEDVDLLNEMCPHIATPKGLFDIKYIHNWFFSFCSYRCRTECML